MTTTDTRQSLREYYQALEDILSKLEEPIEEVLAFVETASFVQGALTVLVDVIDAGITVPNEIIQGWQEAAAGVIEVYEEN